MSMSTSLRYEVENPSAKTLKKALLRQKMRIEVSCVDKMVPLLEHSIVFNKYHDSPFIRILVGRIQ